MVDILIVQDGEQPSPQVGAFFPQMLLGKSAGEAILDEIVGGDRVTGQRPCIAPQARIMASTRLAKSFITALPTAVGSKLTKR